MRLPNWLAFPVALALCFLMNGCGEKPDAVAQLQKDSTGTEIEMPDGSLNYLTHTDWYYLDLPIEIQEKSRGSYSSSGTSESWNWNLLFFNATSGERHLLDSNRIMVIEKVEQPNDQEDTDSTLHYDYLLLTVYLDDDNKDGRINYEDHKHLAVCNLDGTELRRITQKGNNLYNYDILDNGAQLLLTLLDSSGYSSYHLVRIRPRISEIKTVCSAQDQAQLKRLYLRALKKSAVKDN